MPALKKKFKVYDVGYDQHESITVQANKFPTQNKDTIPKLKELLVQYQMPFVEIQLMNCRELPAMDRNRKADPYVIFSIGDRSVRSKIKLRTKNPNWRESFIISVDEVSLNSGKSVVLTAEVYDFDRFSDDDYIGRTATTLSNRGWEDGEPRKFTTNLLDSTQGSLTIAVTRHNFGGYVSFGGSDDMDRSASVLSRDAVGMEDTDSDDQSDAFEENHADIFHQDASKVGGDTGGEMDDEPPPSYEMPQKTPAAVERSNSRSNMDIFVGAQTQAGQEQEITGLEPKQETGDSPASRKSQPKDIIGSQTYHPSQYEVPLNDIFTTEIDESMEPYVDNDFPCDTTSLYDLSESPVIPEGALKCTQWLRLSDICPHPQLFVDGADADDVIQGGLGDCWFLGALSCVGSRQELLDRCIAVVPKHPKRGHYAFRFFKGGQWVTVHVDDRMPCDAEGNLVFSKCREVNEVWVPLMEKAYAKLHGTYQALEAGTSMEGLVDLTGGIALGRFDITPDMASKDELWNEIDFKIHHGEYMMGICVDGIYEERAVAAGLLTDHQYVILDCTVVKNGERLIKIRNPWGCREWNGKWSDDSEEWTEELIKELNVTFGDDGIFYMNYEDFCQHWTNIESVRMFAFNNSWKCLTRKGEWGNSTGGNRAKNPQYLLQLESEASIYVSLMQYDARFTDDDKLENDNIALVLVKYTGSTIDNNFEHVLDLSKCQIITRSKFQTNREVTINADLPAGEYMIIACTYMKETNTTFVVRVFVQESKFQLTALPPFSTIFHSRVFKGEWNAKTSGGCSNTWKWVRNPQYRVKITGATTPVDLLYSQVQIGEQLKPMSAYMLLAHPDDDTVPVNQMKKLGDLGQFTASEILEKVVTNVAPNSIFYVIPSLFEGKAQAKFQGELSINKKDHPDVSLDVELVESEWTSVKSEWTTETAGGCSNHRQTFMNNPKFCVSVQETAVVNFTLCLKGVERKDATGLGMYLFAQENMTRPVANSPFESNLFTNFSTKLEKGQTYVVMPSTFQAGVLRKFKLHAWSKAGVHISLVPQ